MKMENKHNGNFVENWGETENILQSTSSLNEILEGALEQRLR